MKDVDRLDSSLIKDQLQRQVLLLHETGTR
eukprot:SAG31_NODE_34729_length_330_cov_0.653680_1_plen_29_part_01